MSQRSELVLKTLEPLIPGLWNRAEKIQFEIAFHREFDAAMEDFGRMQADKRERDLIQGLHQFEGWRDEIDTMMLALEENPFERLFMHLGQRLRMFLRRAGSQLA